MSICVMLARIIGTDGVPVKNGVGFFNVDRLGDYG